MPQINHVVTRLRAVVAQHGSRTATRIREGDRWVTQTYTQFQDKVNRVAQGLINLGVEPGGRVGIFLANRPEWSEIDFGAATARAVPVPLYATSTPEQISHIAADSGLTVMFVGNQSECERVLSVADELSDLASIADTAGGAGAGVYSTLMARAQSLRHELQTKEEEAAAASSTRLAIPKVILTFTTFVFLLYPALMQLVG